MRKLFFISVFFAWLLICPFVSPAQAETVYFLVAEISPFYNDSYVLPLSNTADIAHARDLIGYGTSAGNAIVVATTEYSNPDGLNRNYVLPMLPAWSWRIQNFLGFADFTIEILDGTPTDVENSLMGTIGFWSYTVVAELGTDLEPWNCNLSAEGIIDFDDLNMLVGQWQQNLLWGPDIDGSNKVGLGDFNIIANHWTDCLGIPSWASYPKPTDTATGAGLHILLKWAAAPDAVSHDLFFGTDEAEVTDADTNDANVYMGNYTLSQWDTDIYDSNGLEYVASYYWRVDERTPCEIAKGDTWSFTTMPEPSAAPVAWWKFDEGNDVNVIDSAGNNDGILRGGTTWVTGKVGPNALQFDGSNDWVQIPDDDTLDIVGQMTISAWIKCNDTGFTPIVAKQPGCSSDFYPGNYQLYIVLDKLKFAHETDSCSDYIAYESSSSVPENVWLHVAVTIVQGGDVNFYINGAGAGSQPQSGVFGIVNDEPVRIGRFGWSDFLGTIDDVQLYNKALNATEILQIYDNGISP
ncbi:MAG: LamG domain-containing protein [Planctomycetes bacterium]|nr:LamG domain-containing protein [Planctomycetota bacterium]